MAQVYARDLAITAVTCFIGGAGLALLVVLVCYQVFLRRKPKQSGGQKEEEKENSSVVNHNVRHSDVSEKRRDVSLQANGTMPWDKESMMLDNRIESHGGRYRSRGDEDGGHFRCLDCNNKAQRGIRPNGMMWNNRINTEKEEGQKRTMRMTVEEERRKPGNMQGILSRDIPNHANLTSQWSRETFSERPENLPVYETNRAMHSYRGNLESKNTGHEILHCESCHRTYKTPQQGTRPGRYESNVKDSALFNGFPPQHKSVDTGRNYNQFDMMRTTELRRESRNVTFDLESLGIVEQGNSQGKYTRGEGVRTFSEKEKDRGNQATVQSSRQLKVKLNLNPLRKSKVHPKKKHERDHKEETSSSKRSPDKRQHRKNRSEKGEKGSRIKGSPEKLKKSTKSRRSSDDSVTVKEKEKKEEEQLKKSTSENEQSVQEKNTNPDNSQSGETTSSADQSTPAVTTAQAPNSQGGIVPNQGTGSVLGSTLSLPAAERNLTTNLSLSGSAGSLLTGGRLSLQGGNLLLSNMAPQLKALLPSSPRLSAAPSNAISGPSLAPGGALDSISRQTVVGLMPPATSLLANTVHANPVQASSIHTAPRYNSQAGPLDLNLAVNPAVNPEPLQSALQTQLPPENASLLDRLKSDPVQAPGPQTGDQLHQLIPDSPQVKESHLVQVQATDSLSVVTSQALGSLITVENLSSPQTGLVAGGSASAGSAVLAEEPAGGVPGDSMQAADVPVSGVSGDAADTAVLLHQEYLSEEGDSSPRRKLRLALPEKTSSRPPTALERKIR